MTLSPTTTQPVSKRRQDSQEDFTTPTRDQSSFKRRRVSKIDSEDKSDHHNLTRGDADSANGEAPQAGESCDPLRVNQIVGGEVFYIPDVSKQTRVCDTLYQFLTQAPMTQFVSPAEADDWYKILESECPWYHPTLKVFGRAVSQSRSIAAYATDKNMVVKYSGHIVDLHYDYPPLLAAIQRKVEALLGEKFNHVMLNYYASGAEYIGKHSDNKENKVIASLSLGAERTFVMSPSKSNKAAGTGAHRWVLGNGSLVVMKGATQENWKHEIPKEPKIKEGRISLTFRQLVFP